MRAKTKNKIVGVNNAEFSYIYSINGLKQLLLFFDQIAVPDLESLMKLLDKLCGDQATCQFLVDNGFYAPGYTPKFLIGEYEWLIRNGLIFQPNFKAEQSLQSSYEFSLNRMMTEAKQVYEKALSNAEKYLNTSPLHFQKSLDVVFEKSNIFAECRARLMALQLSKTQGIEAVSVTPKHPRDQVDTLLLQLEGKRNITDINSGDVEVLEIVLTELPFPDDSTSWEQLLDYKNDPESRLRFLALRKWMRDAATKNIPAKHLREELEYLIADYRAYLKLKKMKIKPGILQTTITAVPEALENIIKFQLGKFANAPFMFRERNIVLLEAERDAPGREISYIVRAQDQFGSEK